MEEGTWVTDVKDGAFRLIPPRRKIYQSADEAEAAFIAAVTRTH
jgi:hypothetical protein